MAEIDIKGFSGANNVKDKERFFISRAIAEPRVILNADADLTGKLSQRPGKTLFWTLPGSHSLWSPPTNLCMLCAANGILYRNISGVATSAGTISGPKYPLSYVEAEGKVYISNPYWQGVFDPTSNTVSNWGVPQPPGPMLLAGDGNLPAGTYHVCMTNVATGELSGNGPITSITLSATGGIQILNRSSGALVWITDKDEYQFVLAGALNKIVDTPSAEPLPTFMCSPPPYMGNLCYAFGRIWGSVGPVVYYSEPYKLGLFKLASGKFTSDSTVTIIAKVPTGLFIGMEDHTVFMQGTEPSEMRQMDAGEGSIKGSLAYCNNLPDLSSVLGTAEKGFTDVPVWLTTEGFVAGNQSGRLFNLTKNKLKIGIPVQGASLYRNLNGMFQFLTNFKQGFTASGKGFSDADTIKAFTDGKIVLSEKRFNGMATRVGFSDSATCQVYRGGVEI